MINLCNQHYSPDKFASDVLSYATYLVHTLHVKKVAIMQLLRREAEQFMGYNDHVLHANITLSAGAAASADPIWFWKHRGMCNTTRSIFALDVVHMSLEEGYPKYLRSVRSCIVRVNSWAK